MENRPIKFLSLNIEGHRHLDRVTEFLQHNSFDVIMFQEVFEQDIHHFTNILQPDYIFKPALIKDGKQWGNLCICTLPDYQYISDYYVGSENSITEYDPAHPENQCKSIVGVTFKQADQHYRILSTHFTWSPKGLPSDQQRIEIKLLFESLQQFPDLVISGDFNTPRGTEIFDAIAERYHDNIPQHITTTIDGNLHKAGPLPYVVDGIFSTLDYSVSDVQILDGLSDHCAIIANITRYHNID